ncbi:MAG TPA: tyrosine-type recombinase/integrase [Gaiellaceae bacterium]
MRHARRCASRSGGDCSCAPTYQAQVWSARDRKPIRKTFPTVAAALAWRQETQVALRRGTLRAPTATTLAEAADAWLTGAEAGIIRTRSGDPYKPSALRSYRHALQSKLLPELGRLRLSAIRRNDLQDLVDRMVAAGRSPSTVRNTILPLRAIYRRALDRDQLAVNPTLKLRLPAVRGKRDRVARADEAVTLLAVLPPEDRALWATALYSGLRRGELQALEWTDINLDDALIHVNRSWDYKAGVIPPKSRAGNRRVPITNVLRQHLLTHRLRQGHGHHGYVFANSNGRPFDPTVILARARKRWRAEKLEPITLHECRHTYAAFMIAAGINVKALSTYMGHTSITVTLDRYGHLLPGNEHHAAALLDTWLQANGAPCEGEARFDSVEGPVEETAGF